MQFYTRFLVGMGAFAGCVCTLPAEDDDIGIAIIYDTSGSMTNAVKDAAGNAAPKYEIANRALEAIVARLEKVAATGRKLQVGLFRFSDNGAKAVVPVDSFDAKKLRGWIAGFNRPAGATPLGNAAAAAAAELLKANLDARHVLVITDGENTVGPRPEEVMPKLMERGLKESRTIYFHFVAFDVNAAAFAGVKREGATLVSAADEKQLNEKLKFVLEEKILLEKE